MRARPYAYTSITCLIVLLSAVAAFPDTILGFLDLLVKEGAWVQAAVIATMVVVVARVMVRYKGLTSSKPELRVDSILASLLVLALALEAYVLSWGVSPVIHLQVVSLILYVWGLLLILVGVETILVRMRLLFLTSLLLALTPTCIKALSSLLLVDYRLIEYGVALTLGLITLGAMPRSSRCLTVIPFSAMVYVLSSLALSGTGPPLLLSYLCYLVAALPGLRGALQGLTPIVKAGGGGRGVMPLIVISLVVGGLGAVAMASLNPLRGRLSLAPAVSVEEGLEKLANAAAWSSVMDWHVAHVGLSSSTIGLSRALNLTVDYYRGGQRMTLMVEGSYSPLLVMRLEEGLHGARDLYVVEGNVSDKRVVVYAASVKDVVVASTVVAIDSRLTIIPAPYYVKLTVISRGRGVDPLELSSTLTELGYHVVSSLPREGVGLRLPVARVVPYLLLLAVVLNTVNAALKLYEARRRL